MRVLIVEDERYLAEAVHTKLGLEAISADIADDGAAALEAVAHTEYDVVLLDRDIPVIHGDEVCRRLALDPDRPAILMLTAARLLDDKVDGLTLGADDYLAKPFHNGELIARIRALIRRAPHTTMPTLEFANLTFEVASQRVACAGVDIALAPSEKDLLELLMRNGGRVVSKAKIEHAFSEYGDERSTNAVELAVSRLRKKLEGHPTGSSIETVRGVGYMMREERA